MKSQLLLEVSSQSANKLKSQDSEYKRIPPSTKNKAVVYYNKAVNQYQLCSDFSSQLILKNPEDKSRREIIEKLLSILNSNTDIFPSNQSIAWYKWVLAWVASFLVLTVSLWILQIVVIFALFNLVILVGAFYVAWMLITRVPVIVSAYFASQKMQAFKKFLKETNKEIGENQCLTYSHDGLYLEFYFNKDDIEDRISDYLNSSTILLKINKS
eukprot:TRINITY_DN3192_c0_g2_i4.p1 TRINITY_DN3192_c0_g2~~TRINITY_DN3192_c0_g2_i4.p1  ORF type:complete len:213 (-),score=55.87 TRINITY_DN3192_c0_g2_i4:102-740(-)